MMINANENCWVDHKSHILWYRTDLHHRALSVLKAATSWQEAEPLISAEIAVEIADVLTSVSPHIVYIIDVEGSVTALVCSPQNEWRVLSSEVAIAAGDYGVVKQSCLFHNHSLFWQEYSSSDFSAVNMYQVPLEFPAGDSFKLGSSKVLLQNFPECQVTRAGETIVCYPRSVEFRFFVTFDGSQFQVYGAHLRCLYSRAVQADQPLKYTEVALLISGLIVSCEESFISTVADPSMKRLLLIDSTNRLLCFQEEDFTVLHQLPSRLELIHPVIHDGHLYSVAKTFDTIQVRRIAEPESEVQSFPVDGRFMRWKISILAGQLLGYISNIGDPSLPEVEQPAPCSTHTDEPLTLSTLKRELSLYAEELDQRSEIVEALDFTPASSLRGDSKLTTFIHNVIAKHNAVDDSAKPSSPRSFSVQPQQIISKMETVDKENLLKCLGFLNYHAESSPQLVFNTLTIYLMTKITADRHAHWKRILTMGKEKSFPLLTIYLYVIWKVQPDDLVDAVLMAGTMIQEVTRSERADLRVVVHLLDLILPAYLTYKTDTNRMGVLAKLLILCGSADHALRGVKALIQVGEFDRAISLITGIDDRHTKSVCICIFRQQLTQMEDVEKRNQLQGEIQSLSNSLVPN